MKCKKQFISSIISFFIIFTTLLQANNVVADGSTNTTLDTARNGVSVVNIATVAKSG